MLKKILLITVVFSSFFAIKVFSQTGEDKKPQNCANFFISDIHIYTSDWNKISENGGIEKTSVAFHYYRKMMESISEEMKKAVANGKADCITFTINGDPYQRKNHFGYVGIEPIEKIEDRAAFIKIFADDMKEYICPPGKYDPDMKTCKHIVNGKETEIPLFLASNLGDHEIPKLNLKPSSESLEGVRNFIQEIANELPTKFKKRLLAFYKGQKDVKDPTLLLDYFYNFMYDKDGGGMNKEKSIASGSFVWANGDDAQRLVTVGQKIAKGWSEAGFYVPENPDKANEPDRPYLVDPRVGHKITMPDGKSFIFSHVDKALGGADEVYLDQLHKNIGHLPAFRGTVLNEFPEGDARNLPQNAFFTTITGDSHVARTDIATAIKMRGDMAGLTAKERRELARIIRTLTGVRPVLNPGAGAANFRQTNGFNGYGMVIPGDDGETKIMALVCSGDEEKKKGLKPGDVKGGIEYSKREVKKWMDAFNPKDPDGPAKFEAQIEKMRQDSKNCKVMPVSPAELFSSSTLDQIEKSYKDGDIRNIMQILKDLKIDNMKGDKIDALKRIISCIQEGQSNLLFE